MLEKIKHHFDNKKYAKFSRAVDKKTVLTNAGYVVAYSEDFILLQETGDLELCGYIVFPVKQLRKIRYNKWDKYVEKIMAWEGEAQKVGISYSIDLKDWKSIFNSIRNNKINVIVKCEAPDIDSFTIGPITKGTKNLVYLNNFDPAGFLDDEPTSINYDDITIAEFGYRYSSVFSKYLRKRKTPKQTS